MSVDRSQIIVVLTQNAREGAMEGVAEPVGEPMDFGSARRRTSDNERAKTTLGVSLLLLLWDMYAVLGVLDLYGTVWNILYSLCQKHKIAKTPLYKH